jgi:hypothetical protein
VRCPLPVLHNSGKNWQLLSNGPGGTSAGPDRSVPLRIDPTELISLYVPPEHLVSLKIIFSFIEQKEFEAIIEKE